MTALRATGESAGVAAGLAGTVVVHAAVIAFLWGTVTTVDLGPPVYAVELVAAPAPAPEQKPAPEAAPRPPVEEPPPAPAPKPSKPAAEVAKPPAPKAPQPAEPIPRTTPRTTPLPGETPSTGNDAVSVSTPGLQFPYPEYLRNIVQEVYRRWERPLGNSALRAEVSFLILRDGTVGEIRLTQPSGSFSFNLSAQGAIEAAGGSHSFGPLPDGYPADVLPVSFYFTPRSP